MLTKSSKASLNPSGTAWLALIFTSLALNQRLVPLSFCVKKREIQMFPLIDAVFFKEKPYFDFISTRLSRRPPRPSHSPIFRL